MEMAEADLHEIEEELSEEVEGLDREIRVIYEEIVSPRWNIETRRYPQTLYGYVMKSFSMIDVLSVYWSGETRWQTPRMMRFLMRYFGADRVPAYIAVQMWRHTLMHTGVPREFVFEGITYRWLLHWGDELPSEQHLTLSDAGRQKILNMSLLQLVDGLRSAVQTYFRDLNSDTTLQGNLVATLPSVRKRHIGTPSWW